MTELHDTAPDAVHSRRESEAVSPGPVAVFHSALRPRRADNNEEKNRICTGIRLIAKTGAVVSARTMEFGVDLESDVMMSPRRHARIGSTPDGADGLHWTAKYASVGISGFGLDMLIDGVNEKGLGVGLFYFAHYA